MSKVSVIIPARNEIFLQKTIDDLLSKAEGDIEILAMLDGYWPDPPIKDDKRVKLIHFGESKGLRDCINLGVDAAQGEYILKLDAHCMVDQGYDRKLVEDCDDDWLVVPRRYRLDAENWCINKDKPGFIDHLYVCFPDNKNDFGGPTLTGREWKDRTKKNKDILIDDLMTFQGSCYFMKKKYFQKLDGLDTDKYGTFGKEPQEIGFKVWLTGGRCVRNKKTWYAHLHKGRKYGRGYRLGKTMLKKGGRAINEWLVFKKAYKHQTLELKWLIDKFDPVPGWEKADWENTEWIEALQKK